MSCGGGALFSRKPLAPCADRLVDVLVEVEGRQYEHLRRRLAAGEQLPGRLEPVELGHADVDQYEVGLELARPRERLAPVTGLADHL
jgi:hypothetical protein